MTWLVLGAMALLGGTFGLGRSGALGVDRTLFLAVFSLASIGYVLGLVFLRRSASSRGANGRGIGVVIVLVAVLARVFVLPVPASDDVYRYLWEGRLQTLGGNPYELAPADAASVFPEESANDPYRSRVNHPELTTIYPPLAELLFRAAGALSYRLLFWKCLMAGMDLLLIGLFVVFLRRVGRPRRAVLAYAWHPLPIICFAGEGHVDILLLLTTWIAFLFLAGGRTVLAGGAWGAAVASKFVPAIYLPLLLRPLGWRGLSAAGLVFAILLLPYATAGDGILRVLFLFGRDMSHNSLLHRVLGSAPGGAVLEGGIVAVFGLGALALGRRCWKANSHGATRGQGVGNLREAMVIYESALGLSALLLLLSPTVHPWYLTWLVPFFVLGAGPVWVTWSLTVSVAFLAYGFQVESGRFHLPGFWTAVEYGPVCLLLLVASIRAFRLRSLGPVLLGWK